MVMSGAWHNCQTFLLGESVLYGQSPFSDLYSNLHRFFELDAVLNTESEQVINPLSTTGHLKPFLIGPYLETFTCVANYDEALKM